MDFSSVYAIAAVIGVIVLALSDVIRKAFNIPARFAPLLALFIGIALGLAATTIHDASLAQLAWGGGIAGLIASGAFDTAKKALSKNAEAEKPSTGEPEEKK